MKEKEALDKFVLKETAFANKKFIEPRLFLDWFDDQIREGLLNGGGTYQNDKKTQITLINGIVKRNQRTIKHIDLATRLNRDVERADFSHRLLPVGQWTHGEGEEEREADQTAFRSTYKNGKWGAQDLCKVARKVSTMADVYVEIQRTKLQGEDFRPGDYVGKTAMYVEVARHHQTTGPTVKRWHDEFEANGYQFRETLTGKWMRTNIFDDNAVMKKEAKDWLTDRIRRKNTKKNPNPVFRMGDWLLYLNEKGGLFDRYGVPPHKLHRLNLLNEDQPKQTEAFLTVDISTARRWAMDLGLKYEPRGKGYFVDGHNNKDVVAYRRLWLKREQKEELRQYRWIQMEEEEAVSMGIAYINGVDKQVRKIAQEVEEKRKGSIPDAVCEKALKRRKKGDSWGKIVSDFHEEEKNSHGVGGFTGGPNVTKALKVYTMDGLNKAVERYANKVINVDKVYHEDALYQGEEKQLDQNHPEYIYHKRLMKEMILKYKDDQNVKMVEVHVDLVPVKLRQERGEKRTIRGMEGVSMGGCMSIRYNATKWAQMYNGEALPPRGIKVGTDEVNFKMYANHRKAWTMDRVKALERKNDGKGCMKVVWVDEILGLGYNHLPSEVLDLFQVVRKKRCSDMPGRVFTENPALIHWEYDVKAATEEGNTTKGYWTAELMLKATKEFVDLFYFLYGEEGCIGEDGTGCVHEPIINMDWSSNHAAKADDCLAVRNFRRSWGTRFFRNSDIAKITPKGDDFDAKNKACQILVAGDFGPLTPPTGLKVGSKQYYTFQKNDAPPHKKKKGAKKLRKQDYVGQDKGLDQILWEQGYDVSAMTMDGNIKPKAPKAPKKKKKGG